MDKSVRALMLAEENAAQIAAMRRSARYTVVQGESNAGITSFGNVGGGAAIVAFDGAACDLVSCGNIVASGSSPLIANVSSGPLELTAERGNAKALVIKD